MQPVRMMGSQTRSHDEDSASSSLSSVCHSEEHCSARTVPENLPSRTTSVKFILFTILMFGSCCAAHIYGQRNRLDTVYQNQAVPTSLLNNGSLGEVLRRLGLVQRVPQDGVSWPAKSTDPANEFETETHLKPGSYQFETATGPTSLGRLLISEVQPSNAGELQDQDGHCPDWIELWNPTENRFDVTGWFLTDDPDSLAKWEFPEMVLQPGERLIVFASGKNSRDVNELHTNFRLAKSGGYTALVRPDQQTVVHKLVYNPTDANHGISFGEAEGQAKPLLFPTPGAENSGPTGGIVSAVAFSQDSCLFESSLSVSLSCATNNATIRYTTDGSLPSDTSGETYEHPLDIVETAVIRAIAIVPGYTNSSPTTRSYLQLHELVRQPRKPPGFPEKWGETEADYEMDPRIAIQRENELKSALHSLPIVSVVAEPDQMFGSGGIYANTWQRGFDWEVPATIELFEFAGKPGVNANCGIRIAGNESRRPEWKKHSLRINFRGRYGLSTLNYPMFDRPGHESPGNNRFATLILRSTDDSWLSHQQSVRNNAQYVRDQWARETELAMGRISSRGRFVHVCLNGLYWGVYNLIERPDDEFLANQLGGRPENYVTFRTREYGLVADDVGERVWNEISELANHNLAVEEHYDTISRRLDLVDFVDYCLIQMYAGGEDWPLVNGNNMRAYRHKDPNSRLRFMSWDADSTFASGWHNNSVLYTFKVEDEVDETSFQELFNSLICNESFRRLFESRLQLWSSHGAALSPDAARNRYQDLTNRIGPALIAESARWGDVYSSEPYTPNEHWRNQKRRILEKWFDNRTELILEQLRKYWN